MIMLSNELCTILIIEVLISKWFKNGILYFLHFYNYDISFFYNKNELEITCTFRKREDNLLFSKLLIVKNCSSHLIV